MTFGNRIKLFSDLNRLLGHQKSIKIYSRNNISKIFNNQIVFFHRTGLLYVRVNTASFSDKNKIVVQQQQDEKKQNERQSGSPYPPVENNPIRRLMRIKDFVDFLIFIFLVGGIYYGYKKYKDKDKNDEKHELTWITVPFFKHKLFTCSGFYLPEFIAKNISNLKSFEPRKDDVWVISFPKSGTTWVQEIVYLIANGCDFEKAKSDSIENRSPFFEYPSPGLKFIENMKSTRVIKTHLPISLLPENVENKSKVVYIIRNPKDVTVSYYHFTNLSIQSGFTGIFGDFVQLFTNGTVPYGPWWKHVDEHTSKKNVHIIHYEELQEKPFEVIKSLCEFLGKSLTDSQLKAIVEWCSFENMKKNPTVNYDWYKEIGFFRKDGDFMRKGQVGDWLNHFSKNDSLKMDEIIEKNLNYKHSFNYGISRDDLAKIYSIDMNKKDSK